MTVKRFDVGSWLDSPMSRRRLDLSQFAEERAVVVEICARVAAEGDGALRELGMQFDGWAPGAGETFEVPTRELAAAAARLAPADRAALEFAAQRIRDFHSRQLQSTSDGPPGLKLVTRPVARTGLYIPGGRAAYPSTVLMTVIPARIAKVPEVVLVTPPRPDGSVPTAILAAAHIAGVDAVYRVGGAQAIAALAYGTATIPRVDVVAGPGNIYVTLAKREVFGAVGVDGIAGPTEVMVIADAGARPDYVAADLAAQLEHDPLAWGVLVTDSSHLADRVEEELESLLPGLEREAIIRKANCCIVVADNLDQAMDLANNFAPEHLLIVTADASRRATQVENAGAVFVGPYATVPLGDYVAGPNHTLPTAGAARFASPLGVHTFLKRTSVLSLNRGDLEMLRDACVRLATMEGLSAHAHAVEVRLE
ncbi:MAG TPA: histidinol dehydrogenase [Candidatus Dormibacteraeota bacterium]|nr:histidinol dehydrogenase [Candidatus Dormibacteraeota bacterium]